VFRVVTAHSILEDESLLPDSVPTASNPTRTHSFTWQPEGISNGSSNQYAGETKLMIGVRIQN
jgi:hypothetical protein